MEHKRDEFQRMLEAARHERHKLEGDNRRADKPKKYKDLDKRRISQLKDHERDLKSEIDYCNKELEKRGINEQEFSRI